MAGEAAGKKDISSRPTHEQLIALVPEDVVFTRKSNEGWSSRAKNIATLAAAIVSMVVEGAIFGPYDLLAGVLSGDHKEKKH